MDRRTARGKAIAAISLAMARSEFPRWPSHLTLVRAQTERHAPSPTTPANHRLNSATSWPLYEQTPAQKVCQEYKPASTNLWPQGTGPRP
jgi:hypothetical protein